jgi:hypothetical protein
LATIDYSITVRARAADVFPYFTDTGKAISWQSSLVEARFAPDGPIRAGTRITEVRQLLGRRLESVIEVTELDPPRRFAGRVLSGPMQWEFRHLVEEEDGETTLSFHLEGDPGGFFRLAEPLIVRRLRKEIASDLETLRGLVEESPEGPKAGTGPSG